MALDIILRWAIPAVLGGIVGAVSAFFSKQRKTYKNLCKGVQCMLRAQIVMMHDEYVNKRKHCPVYVRETASRAYHAYSALGGNDVATDLYKDILALPTVAPKSGGD